MDDARARAIVRKLGSLPTLPQVVSRIMKTTLDEGSSASDVASIISTDQALTSRVLRVANSAFYGFEEQIATVSHAVVILGFEAVKTMCLSVSVFEMFGEGGEDFDREAFWEHSLAAAVAAKVISKKSGKVPLEEAFVGGLLHDIGRVVLDQYMHEEFMLALADCKTGEDLSAAEGKRCGMDHTEVGGALAEHWRLPQPLRDAIVLHHSGIDVVAEMPLAATVRLANLLVGSEGMGFSGDQSVPAPTEADWATAGCPGADPEPLVEQIHLELSKAGVYLEQTKQQWDEKTHRKQLEAANEQLAEKTLQIDQANAALAKRNEDLHRAQEQLVRSARLSALGELAGGIAHELNTPMAAILAYTQMLQSMAKRERFPRDAVKYLGIIEDQAVRCGQMARNLLDYARRREQHIEQIDINSVVEKALSIAEPELASGDIRVVRSLARGLPHIWADAAQLEQVFLNIILNARHAMGEGGELRVSSRKDTIPVSGSPGGVHRRAGDPEGVAYVSSGSRGARRISTRGVCVSISDNGSGISEEHINRVFEPFFTTKGQGGTGLGLSISRSIVEAHHGLLEVKSAVGKGTTFFVKLPLEQAPADSVPLGEAEPEPKAHAREVAAARRD